jgi:hypothetical protein
MIQWIAAFVGCLQVQEQRSMRRRTDKFGFGVRISTPFIHYYIFKCSRYKQVLNQTICLFTLSTPTNKRSLPGCNHSSRSGQSNSIELRPAAVARVHSAAMVRFGRSTEFAERRVQLEAVDSRTERTERTSEYARTTRPSSRSPSGTPPSSWRRISSSVASKRSHSSATDKEE